MNFLQSPSYGNRPLEKGHVSDLGLGFVVVFCVVVVELVVGGLGDVGALDK